MRDPISSSTHLLAAMVALVLTLFLFRLTRSTSARIFGISATLLYSASALYHAPMLPRDQLRPFQLLDQSMIFVLIAGSFTPMAVYLLPRRVARPALWVMWGLAALGIAALWLLPKPPHSALVGIYLGMGNVGTLSLLAFARSIGREKLGWAVGGGLFYIAGAVCELTNWPVILPGTLGPHEILHVCDMAGTACHAILIFRLAVPTRSTINPRPALS